ncbi:hypothetical protein A2W14_05835 [Candidatus Gottesmanbacteria bacterium RBG_16_37_8]|uniref:Chemotaxis methyl-accepting receptor HlyB-like 4HB MCP domain-containing protein n=1 Tax=Candidatus Gottesmanbacteria bacterium RBG_16_37_8 TaxID=1798371 RepID=A0A1F5YV08_9BACT|nr:MAG: hypothetical protein A2W14_05835 [Candidatus Gottesmanbacteria bacterium RBG_16_37_8]
MFSNLSLPFDNYYKFITSLGVLLSAIGMYQIFNLGITAPYEFSEIKSTIQKYEHQVSRTELLADQLKNLMNTIDDATRSGKNINNSTLENINELIKKIEIEFNKSNDMEKDALVAVNKGDAMVMKIEIVRIISFLLTLIGALLFINGSLNWLKKTQQPLDKKVKSRK